MNRMSVFRVGFRSYILLLCFLYLIVMLLFHADIQDPRPNPKHGAGLDLSEEVYPPIKKIYEAEKQQLSQQKQLTNDEELRFRYESGPAPLSGFDRHNITLSGKPLVYEDCVGPHKGKDSDFYELLPGQLYLYTAYYDTRPNDFDNLINRTYIRMIAILRSRGGKPDLKCEFLTLGGSWMTTDVHYYEMCENHGRPMGGFILSCPVPAEVEKKPCTVRVFPKWRNDTSYTMFVNRLAPRESRSKFAICVPPLYGKISKPKLVEFIEVSKILGAERIVFYDYRIPEEAALVLKYYLNEGFVDVVQWRYPDSLEKYTWYHGQMVAIQDCLYRNMHSAEYLAFNDIDEYIVPRVHDNWGDMTEALFQPDQCAYQITSAFFPPGQPEVNDTIVLSSMRRSLYKSSVRTKCLVSPYMIFEKGIHHISKPIWAHLKVVRMPEKIAFIHHYRNCMRDFAMNCREYEQDSYMLKYKNPIKMNIYESLLRMS